MFHVVDGSGDHAGQAYKTVRTELKAYGHGLAEKTEIVALSKVDALTPKQLKQQAARLKRAAGKSPMIMSAASGQGVTEVLRALTREIGETARLSEHADTAEPAWQP